MVLMALDHARDFFHFGAIHGFNPLDLATTTPALFLARWITHFCAPTFVFLAGAGAFLSGARGKSPAALSRFLLTRGVWLIVLEWTFVQWAGWTWAVDLHRHFALVIWAIGWSMIALAALVRLPTWAVATCGMAMIFLHNVLDGVRAERLGAWGPWWKILHAGGEVPLGGGHVIGAGYPLVPWVGVMAAGYGFGALLTRPDDERRRWLARLGLAACGAFLALRFSNLYGDAHPWAVQASPWQTAGAFLDCVKYPPSLCYLLMTLGPALLLLACWDRGVPAWARPLLVFGRVPMLFYLLHIPLLHAMAALVMRWQWGRADWLYGVAPAAPPADAGFGLVGTAVAWAVALAVLFFACRWFGAFKRRRRDAWLGYV
ncbi:MAG: hypothetical protein RLZZ15_1398 [Verrucomicrobiota bacterium]|jgi:uncharacterized membrane protein